MTGQRPPVEIDRELCVGHGRCYGKAPEMFYADDMGHGHVKDEVEPTDKPTDVARVVRACPENAIHLITTS